MAEINIDDYLKELLYFGEYIQVTRSRFSLPRDPTDAKLVELAIDAKATHIITYDADLLSLPKSRTDSGKRFRQRLRNVSVLRPEDFLATRSDLRRG